VLRIGRSVDADGLGIRHSDSVIRSLMCQSVHHLASQWLAVATVRDPPFGAAACESWNHLWRTQNWPIGALHRECDLGGG
jgi:hypothetical protein